MSNEIVVYKGRRNVITVGLGIDVSGDTFKSQIRSEPELDAPLICEWVITFATTGADGELVLTLDDSITSNIQVNSGYMDLLRISGGEPLPVFDRVVDVVFRGGTTVP